eukprot:Rhum_TRINITY_DN14426_c4_g2::Rhum_TRINITY_DN14426_c4_g2_i1::g.87185::m.87185/K07203/MTOR, FRAP, TOR; serine/threonine-protein kinase mTOR
MGGDDGGGGGDEKNKNKAEVMRLKVFARVRPPFPGEYDKGGEPCMTFGNDERTIVHADRTYDFDEVFQGDCSQNVLFERIARPTIDNAFKGFAGTVFVYGQTGTGKTHTMSNYGRRGVEVDPKEYGIIPRAVDYLFDIIHKDSGGQYTVTMQYLQLYRDNLQDLLSPDSGYLKLADAPGGGTVIQGVTTSPEVHSTEEFFEVYDEADKNRVVAETMMNKHSSRGHSVLTVFIKRAATESTEGINGKLVFVDLAGYERIKKTMIKDEVRKHEAQAINLSLGALAACIAALTAKSSHIPFRNSRLTRVLYDSLAGNSVTSVIITLGPSSLHSAESANTLYFGYNAIQCKTSVKRDLGPVDWQKEALQWKKKAVALSSQLTEMEAENKILLARLAEAGLDGDDAVAAAAAAAAQPPQQQPSQGGGGDDVGAAGEPGPATLALRMLLLGRSGGATAAVAEAAWLSPLLRGCRRGAAEAECAAMYFAARNDEDALHELLPHATTFRAGGRGPLLARLHRIPCLTAAVEKVVLQICAVELDQTENDGLVCRSLRDIAEVPLSGAQGCPFISAYVLPCCSHRSGDVRLEAYNAVLSVAGRMEQTGDADGGREGSSAGAGGGGGGRSGSRDSASGSPLSLVKECVANILCDPDAHNRLAGLRKLEETTPGARLTAVCDATHAMFCMALSDVDFEVRKAAVELVCRRCCGSSKVRARLAHHVQAQHYALRRHPSQHKQAEAAYHVGLCHAALRRARGGADGGGVADVGSLLTLLMQRLSECEPSSLLQFSVLQALALVFSVEWEAVAAAADALVPALARVVQEQSVSRCTRPAVAALARVLQCAGGGVFGVYERHRGLYSRLLSLLNHRRGASQETRVEIMKLLGVLGAVEPALVRRLGLQDSVSDTSQKDFSSAWTSISTLLEVLSQPWHLTHHDAAAKATVMVLNIIGKRRACLQVPRIVPAFLKLLTERCAAQAMWSATAAVVSVPGVPPGTLQPHVQPLLLLVAQRWDESDPATQAAMAAVVCELHVYGCDLGDVLEEFVPRLAHAASSSLDAGLGRRACLFFEKVRTSLTACQMHCVCVCVATMLLDPDHSAEVRLGCVRAIAMLSTCTATFDDSAAVVLQALIQLVAAAAREPERDSLSTHTNSGPFAGSRHSLRLNGPASAASVAGGDGGTPSQLCADAAEMLRELLGSLPESCLGSLQSAALDAVELAGEGAAAALSPTLHRESSVGQLLPNGSLGGGSASAEQTPQQTCNVGIQDLRSALYVKDCCTHSDYVKWYDRLCLVLLRESPRSVLRAVAGVAAALSTVARSLLNVSFAVCHRDLLVDNPEAAAEMVDTLEEALQAGLPEEVLQPLLDLSDYLERFSIFEVRLDPSGGCARPRLLRLVNPSHQAHLAEGCGLHTKALRLAECCDVSKAVAYRQLVRVNVDLGLPDAAEGIMRLVQKSDVHDAAAYADLGLWNEALATYEARLRAKDASPEGNRETVVGLITALDKKSDWHRMLQCVARYWTGNGDDEMRRRIAPMVAHGAWLMGQWSLLEEASALIASDTAAVSTPGTFYKAVLAFQHGRLREVPALVQQCRKEIDVMMATSSYHCYKLLVTLQHLTEIEEMLEFKANKTGDRGAALQTLWKERMTLMQLNPRHLHDTYTLRTLVLPKRENIDDWICFAKTCHLIGQTDAAKQLLKSLAAELAHETDESFDRASSKLQLAQCEIQWDVLTELASRGLVKREYDAMAAKKAKLVQGVEDVLARVKVGNPEGTDACLLLSSWRSALGAALPCVLDPLERVLAGDNDHYDAWCAWTLVNMRALYGKEALRWGGGGSAGRNALLAECVKGLSRCVALNGSDKDRLLQDALRLLHLPSSNDPDTPPELVRAMHAACLTVPADVWASLTPQLVSRLTPSARHPAATTLQALAAELLCKVAEQYPQVVMLPLIIEADAPETESVIRRLGCEEWQQTYEEAHLLVRELVRISEAWEEAWISSLAKAHSLILGMEKEGIPAAAPPPPAAAAATEDGEASGGIGADAEGGGTTAAAAAAAPTPLSGVAACVEPHFASIQRPQTPSERLFVATHAVKLRALEDALKAACGGGGGSSTAPAPSARPPTPELLWRLKAAVLDLWRALHKSLPTRLSLRDASPSLAELRGSSLCVPGTAMAGDVTIAALENTVYVIASLNRPRKICMLGTDGAQYRFLLKGKEDVRLDERIMQFLGMANTMLKRSAVRNSPRLAEAVTYAVIPVARRVGLIEWLDQADNIECVINEVKQRGRGGELQVVAQQRGVKKLDWETMPHEEKVSVLAAVEQSCPGDALQAALWLRAANSKIWIERRTAFSRSLAVMSILGYVIGLGDRHLGNILLHGPSGKVVHIDFEESFDSAMRRTAYPECVPFRLTRQLRNAMGVGGAEGVFRRTAICAMQALRTERHAILALIESFIYEPTSSVPAHAGGGGGGGEKSAAAASSSASAPGTTPTTLRQLQQKLEGTDRVHYVRREGGGGDGSGGGGDAAAAGSSGGADGFGSVSPSSTHNASPSLESGSLGSPGAAVAGGATGSAAARGDASGHAVYPSSLYAATAATAAADATAAAAAAPVVYPAALYHSDAAGGDASAGGYMRSLYRRASAAGGVSAGGAGGGGGGGVSRRQRSAAVYFDAASHGSDSTAASAGHSSAGGAARCRVTTPDTPHAQVDRLLEAASALDNLARMYKGWKPWV